MALGISVAALGIRFFLFMVLLFAGVAKWRDPIDARALLAALQWQHLQLYVGGTFSRVMGAIEITLAVMLALGTHLVFWTAVVGGLFLLLTTVLILARRRGYSGGCLCFGASSASTSTIAELMRNLLFIACTVYLLTVYIIVGDSVYVPTDTLFLGLLISFVLSVIFLLWEEVTSILSRGGGHV